MKRSFYLHKTPAQLAMICVLFGSLSGCTSTTSEPSSLAESPLPTESSPTELHTGQNLFETNCLVCHAPGTTRGIDLLVKNSPKFCSAKDLLIYLRRPGLGMPAFGEDQLSDAEVRTLYDALKQDYGD